MVGTAGLPHVIQRFYVVPKVTDARWSVVWGLFFICLVYWTAPAYSAFGKLLSSNPDVGVWQKMQLWFILHSLADVNSLIVGLLAAGAISAAFSTVAGLLVAGSSAFSHDLYVRVINPASTPKEATCCCKARNNYHGTGSYYCCASEAWADRPACCSCIFNGSMYNFPPVPAWYMVERLKPGRSKSRADRRNNVTIISITYFIVGLSGGSLPGQEFISYWLNVWYFAWIGAPLAIVVNIIVSLLTAPTPLEIKKFLAEQVHN